MTNTHISVMLEDAVAALNIQPNSWYVDCTFGSGGHTKKLLSLGARVIALDFDEQAVAAGNEAFAQELADKKLYLVQENFSELERVIAQIQSQEPTLEISGVLFDFGTSTLQLMSQTRGFSFEGDGPLDMRMDQRLGVQAKDLLAIIPEKQLCQLFFEMGGETDAKRIAKAIKASPTPITTTGQLSQLVQKVKGKQHSKLNPATKVFQALRIAVNTELDNISQALPQALQIVKKGGVIVTIAFHEGEDKIVKHTFKSWEATGKGTVTTKKPLTPSAEELEENKRARSAKMRIFEKTTL